MAPSNCTIYQNTDGSAPGLTGRRGSAAAVLKACLVDGYGAKLAAGWTMPYQNAGLDITVFRNNATEGTGSYLRLDENTSAVLQPLPQGYLTMSDIDTGTGLFIDTPINPSYSFRHGTGDNDVTCKWIIVANDVSFYFFSWPYVDTYTYINTTGTTLFYFGDFLPFYSDDAYPVCMGFGSGYSSNASWGIFTQWMANSVVIDQNANCGLMFPSQYRNTVYNYNAGCQIWGGGPDNIGRPGNAGSVYSAGDPLFINRGFLPMYDKHTPRGYLPGLYFPIANKPFDTGDIITKDTTDYFCVTGNAWNTGFQVLINITNFWE